MARPRQRRTPTVERKIYFYRADVGVDDGGRRLSFDPAPTLTHVDGLAFDAQGRYWETAEHITCCWVDSADPPQKLRLATVRRSALPQVEDHGTVSALQLPATSGLVEAIHVVFFPDNIVGSEFNFYGPRLSRLSGYLAARAQDVTPVVSFEPLLRGDVADQLRRLEDIRLLQLKITASYADVVEQANRDLGNAFKAAARAGAADDLEIILRPRPYSRGSLAEELLAAVRQLAGRNDLRENSSRFVVRGLNRENEHIDEIDVLKDKLISVKRIVREDERTRALVARSAYEAIEEAFAELRDDVIQAAGVQP